MNWASYSTPSAPPVETGTAGDQDAALVAATRADPRAFSALYERYLPLVYRFCYLRLHDQQAAEDATGEVFFKALRGLPSFRNGVFAAWLFQIARNVLNDAFRRSRPNSSLDEALELADPAADPEDAALTHAERAILAQGLAGLPDNQRTVIELKLAGWSAAQIATAMDRTVPAVKMLRYRAVESLRQQFKRKGYEVREGGDE